MNKFKKNIGIVVLSFVLIIIAICAGLWANTTTDKKEELEFSIILPDSNNTKWKTLKTGMRAAAKEYGISLKITDIEKIQAEDQLQEALQEAVDSSTDGIITEFTNQDEADTILSSTLKNVPVVLTKPIYETSEVTNSSLGIMNIDTSAISNTLALQVSRNHKTENINIGLLAENDSYYLTQKLIESLQEILKESNANVLWTLSNEDLSTTTLKTTQSKNPVDVIIALDSSSLEVASDYKTESNDSVDLYGIGTSDKCIYNTDIEVINSIIIPDDYYSGYTAVSQLYKKIKNNESLSTYTVNYRIISNANLYTSTNQKLLFPIGN